MSKYQKMLNFEELERHFAEATAPDEQRRWQLLLHVAAGTPLAQITLLTGYQPRSIRQIVRRYVEFGADSVVDQRAFAPGATPLLSPQQEAALREALQHAPAEGGQWTGPKVARWIAATTGKPTHRQRGWEYLRRLQQSANGETPQ